MSDEQIEDSLFSQEETDAAQALDFADEEVIDESDEQDEETDVEESDEDDLEGDETDEDEESEDGVDGGQVVKFKELNDNLNKALKSERGKRKGLSTELKELQAQLKDNQGSGFEDSYNKLVEQITELDLQDVLKVDKPKEQDPQIKKLLKMQEEQEQQTRVQTFYNDMREEVSNVIQEYPNIDVKSQEQGAIISQMIVASVSSGGSDLEEATANALSALDGLLSSTKESTKKARKPEVKPRKKQRSATASRRKTSSSKRASQGDFGGVFSDLAGSLLDK